MNRPSVTKVEKPWGYELRFIRTAHYAGKVLWIKAGAQLSLQYHEHKDEAFYVQFGEMELVLGQPPNQAVVKMQAGESHHITPRTVHRFRALEDTLLFEVSTPELEDVVRIDDDYGRKGLTDTL